MGQRLVGFVRTGLRAPVACLYATPIDYAKVWYMSRLCPRWWYLLDHIIEQLLRTRETIRGLLPSLVPLADATYERLNP